MNKPVNTFETFNVDLAAYLMLEGLKLIECTQGPSSAYGKPQVVMRFFDEHGKARDLERVFMGSEMKKYRDYHKYLLRSIHRCIKGID